MKVVDVEDAGDGLHGVADGGELHVARCALEEDVEALADDADGAPEDHGGDEDGQQRVDPRHAGEQDGCATDDDGGGGEGVAEHVEEDAADVDVAGEAPEESGDGAVHQDAGGCDVHHKLRPDGDGNCDTVDGFDGDPGREDDEGGGVDEGREDTCALVAEGLLLCGGTRLEVDGNEREDDGEEVAEVVAGLGDEGQGVGAEAKDEGGDDVGEGQRHGELQNALHLAVRRGDHVHDLSVVRRRARFNAGATADGARIDAD